MKSRKFISLLLIVCIALFYWAIVSTIAETVTVANMANHKQYQDANELFAKADLVVIGSTDQNLKESKLIANTTPNGLPGEKYSLTDFNISKVIKGDYKSNNVKVLQDASYIDGKYFVLEGYTPFSEKKKYILFLLKTLDSDNYAIMGLNQGKFNVDGQDSKEEKQIQRNEHYSKLKKEVFEKFKVELN